MHIDPVEARDLARLMQGGEEIIALCNREKLPYWLDWGSLLGYQRHGNVIPWDNDLDLCMLEPEHQAFRAIFHARGNTIGNVSLDPYGYGETHACCWLTIDNLRLDYGIDVMSYRIDADASGQRTLRSLMSPALIAQYPEEYDFPWSSIYPVDYVPFLGKIATVPPDIPNRLTAMYGADWHVYPAGKSDSPLCRSPWKLTEHLRAAAEWDGILPAIAPNLHKDPDCTEPASDGIRLWWLLNNHDLPAPSDPSVVLEETSFTNLVFSNDRALWGKVHMALVKPGETLLIPSHWQGAVKDVVWPNSYS